MTLDNNKITKVYNAIVNKVNALIGTHDSNSSAHSTIMATKVNTSDITDNLITNDATKPLSAKQGKVLKDTIDAIDGANLLSKTDVNDLINLFSFVEGTVLQLTFNGTNFAFDHNTPLVFTNSLMVDWGDGITQPYAGGELTHTYSSNEIHIIRISGDITGFGTEYKHGNYSGAFYGMGGLVSIEIPNTITTIPNLCFYGAGLTNIAFPEGVTSIGGSALSSCNSLKTISIPTSVTSIGGYLCSSCSQLETVNVFWENSTDIVAYNSWLISSNANAKIIIPKDTTDLYTAKDYPSDKLVERN